jgi:uncharacterized protein YqgV (UPF0045/DUF77 family)
VVRLDFTVEPFHEGRPGAHVTAPIEALTARGVEVDFGAFGTSCEIDSESVAEAVADVVRTAFANGATRLTIEVAGGDGESA